MNSIAQKINTLEAVAENQGFDLAAAKAAFEALPIAQEDREYVWHAFLWAKIADAYNEGWIAEPTKHGQQKWYLYLWQVFKDKSKRSGFGFSDTYTGYSFSNTHVGARHFFKESQLCRDAFENFPEAYAGAYLVSKLPPAKAKKAKK